MINADNLIHQIEFQTFELRNNKLILIYISEYS